MLQAIFGPRETLGDEFVHLLHGLTEGNPFFVEETLKALIVAGDLAPTGDGGWRARPLERVRVPRTAVEAVRRRLAALTVPARAVASTAAVAGRRFDFELLQALTRHDERELLALVKELIAAQLVVEESAERFAFRHALTREAIYAELLARERVALHRDVAAALERSTPAPLDAVVEALAYHAWEAGDWERAATLRGARRPARARAVRAARGGRAPRPRLRGVRARGRRSRAVELHARARRRERDARRVPARERGLHRGARAGARRPATSARVGGAARARHAVGGARLRARRRVSARGARAWRAPSATSALVARSLNRVGNWHVNLEEPQAGLPHHEEALAIFERLGDRRGVARDGGPDRDGAPRRRRPARRGDVLRAIGRAVQRSWTTGAGSPTRSALLALCGPSYHVVVDDAVHERRRAPTSSGRRSSVRLAREIGWRAGEAFLRFIIGDCLGVARRVRSRDPARARGARAWPRRSSTSQWTAGARRLLGALSLDLLAPDAARASISRRRTRSRSGSARASGSAGRRRRSRWRALATGRSAPAPRSCSTSAARGRRRSGRRAASRRRRSLTLGERQLWLARAELALAKRRPETALQIVDARLAAERGGEPDSALGVPRLSLVARRRARRARPVRRGRARAGAARARRRRAQGARPLLWRVEAAVGHLHRAQRQTPRGAPRVRRGARARRRAGGAGPRRGAARPASWTGAGRGHPAAPAPSAARRRRRRSAGSRAASATSRSSSRRARRTGRRATSSGSASGRSRATSRSALAKLGFASRTQLAAWAVSRGLAEPPSGRAAATEFPRTSRWNSAWIPRCGGCAVPVSSCRVRAPAHTAHAGDAIAKLRGTMTHAFLGRSNFSRYPSLTPTIFMLKQQRQTPVSAEPDPLAARVRATWTSGDFGRIARGYELGAAQFITRLGLEPGERVLDVATGTGNLAIPAARTGALVTGVDIAPNLITQAKARAAAEGLAIRLDVGDAESLGYDDDEFDTAVSMFGAMFAARPERAASELLRVVRPGGASRWPTGRRRASSARCSRRRRATRPPRRRSVAAAVGHGGLRARAARRRCRR